MQRVRVVQIAAFWQAMGPALAQSVGLVSNHGPRAEMTTRDEGAPGQDARFGCRRGCSVSPLARSRRYMCHSAMVAAGRPKVCGALDGVGRSALALLVDQRWPASSGRNRNTEKRALGATKAAPAFRTREVGNANLRLVTAF